MTETEIEIAPAPTAEEIEAKRIARELAQASRVAAARAAFPAVVEAADQMAAARATFYDAVKQAASGASLRQVALAADVSPEQVRRIQDGRAK